MTDLRTDFDERVGEVEAYLKLVEAIERSVQDGTPTIRTKGGDIAIQPLQQRILYAGVYLHLYNLVEATISRCVGAVESAASDGGRWKAGDLSAELRSEWVKCVARTSKELSTDNRLKAALELAQHLVAMLPVVVKIEKGGGGNWDDVRIDRFVRRFGLQLQLKRTTQESVRRPLRENKGALTLIKHLRNKLAHGEMSFAECGDGLSSGQLYELKKLTVLYLEEVIGCFENFIRRHEFLHPTKRPAAGAG